MVRWVVCGGFALGLACTMSNPLFVVDDAQTTGGPDQPPVTADTGDSSDMADSSGADAAASASGSSADESGDPSPGTTGAGLTTSGVAPDETTTTATTGSPDTTDTTTDASTSGESTGEPGPCMDICGTPGCGDCPDHEMVAYPGFEIGSREVSNGEYQQFLAAQQDPAIQPGECAWNDDFTPTQWPVASATLPVVNIDWCDARAYCAWAGKRLCGAIAGGPTQP